MKAPFLPPAIGLLLLGLAACTSPVAPGERVTEIEGKFPELRQGMEAAEVRRLLGEPAEVRPAKSPPGHIFEVWVYNIETSLGTTQVATGLQRVPTTNPFGLPSEVTETVYSVAEKRARIKIELFMVDDQLQAQKASGMAEMEF